MSILFSPGQLGALELQNRFVHSATYECMATADGRVTEQLVKRYRAIARGEVGLIIPGYMFVEQAGKALPFQTGIHADEMIPGLARLADAVHAEGGKIIFQLVHAGRQTLKTTTGEKPMGPSATARDPSYFVKPREMTRDDIKRVTDAFVRAAVRAVAAGADGVQLHGAHGYLISAFLSPFFNVRGDQWGRSTDNRFRFLASILKGIKAAVPEPFAVLIKLNGNDHTPQIGVTPDLAAIYCKKTAKSGVHGVEVSGGTILWSFMNTCRGDVPVDELLHAFPPLLRPMGRVMLNRMKGKYDHEEAYNLQSARVIRRALNGMPLILVGGMRTVRAMETVLENGEADLIAMSRPFIREPNLVKKIRRGKTDRALCNSCNRCFGTITAQRPLRCMQGNENRRACA